MRAPRDPELKQLIAEAMKDRAPAMYNRLMMAGELETVIAERAMLARETATEILSETQYEILRMPAPDALKQAGRLEQAQQAAWRTALDQAVEFPTEESAATSAISVPPPAA